MKIIWKFLSLVLLLLCLICESSYSQGSDNRQVYYDYFEDNYYSLNSIEGIYKVELNIDKPILFCENCKYTSLNIKDFDEIAIVYRNGKFEISSITRGVLIGYVESTSRDQNFRSYGSFVMRMNAMNYPNLRVISSLYGDMLGGDISQYSDVPYEDIYKVFENDITRKISIKCDSELKEIWELVCLNFKVEHNYKKIFPTSDFKPNPQKFTGTGFLVHMNGYVLTNYHVIRRPSNMKGFFNESIKLINESTKTEFEGSLICFNEELDLALIKINIPENVMKYYKALKISQRNQSISTSVSTVGYPFGNITGSNIKYTKGYISSETGPYNTPTLYTIDLSVNPGNSGGPLLDSQNNVVGVISARLNDEAVGSKVENIGFAVKTSYVIEFIKKNFMLFESTTSSDKSVRTIEDIKKGVFMIEFTIKPM
jgi:S1-C subfamily serine protease